MKDIYVIIQTGYEGIEKLCYLTNDRQDAIKHLRKEQEKEIKEKLNMRKEMNEYWRENRKGNEEVYLEPEEFTDEERQNIKDFFCIQKWDGKKFECACGELEVNPSKLMLR